jgi:hypothetical protein
MTATTGQRPQEICEQGCRPGQLELDRLYRTAGTGQTGRDSQGRTAGSGNRGRTALAGLTGQNRRDKASGTRHLRQDIGDKDSLDRKAETGRTG